MSDTLPLRIYTCDLCVEHVTKPIICIGFTNHGHLTGGRHEDLRTFLGAMPVLSCIIHASKCYKWLEVLNMPYQTDIY